jgi:hypothetical protein
MGSRRMEEVMDGTFYYHNKEQIISLHLGLLESGKLESVIPTNPQFIYSKHNECIQFGKKKERNTDNNKNNQCVRAYVPFESLVSVSPIGPLPNTTVRNSAVCASFLKR